MSVAEGWNKEFPRIQLLTAEEILGGKKVEYPALTGTTFKDAPAVNRDKDLELPFK
jgi:hypothetical protein